MQRSSWRSPMLAAATVGALIGVARAEPAAMSTPVEIAARLPVPLGNVTITPDGRTVVSHHPMFETAARVSEVTSPTTLKPFPNEAWNTPRSGAEDYLDGVLGLRSDSEGTVWMLDMGTRTGITPKLVAWDTRQDRLARIIPLSEPATRRNSEPNDFVIDEPNQRIYITDEGVGRGGDGSAAALIVVDLKAGRARRVLEGHASTRPEDVPITVDGRILVKQQKDGNSASMRSGADGVTLDHRSEWLYYGPLNGGAVYRLRVADLLDERLDPGELGRRVERYADRPNAGGIAIDRDDNLYLTEIENRAIGIIPAKDRRYRRFATHPDMLWPDGFGAGADGWIYVTVTQLALAATLNGGKDGSAPPFLLARFKPLADGKVGQ